ncbi:uncharacterized protein LOC135833698 [Planococcus citri]|uniref:uncharacterized protein LOC135833698 n=1 Tax=Planococcus citri TaxID=170843 RepID=UPI0031F9E1D2
MYYRFCDLHVWKIILKVRRLEENLIFCNLYLEIRRIGSMGVFFWFFQFFVIMGTMYYTLWPTLVFFLIDSICMFYFEAWVTIPYLQFVGWISFLCYVSCRVQHRTVDINKLEYLTNSDFCEVKSRLAKMTWEGYEFEKVKQIKKTIGLMKLVLSISSELSAAYGTTVLFYIANYVSRSIIQFYDLIDKDAQKFPMWMSAWNVMVRIIFLLPLFICCEHLTYNVNKTVKIIQEIVTLHQPSCLDCIFQSLTLRLKHQSTTIRICGFLNITYSSFLMIMTTALAFLLLQLQF